MSLNHFPWHLLHWHWNTMYKQGYSPRPQSNNKGLYYVKLSFSSFFNITSCLQCVVRPTKWGGEAHLFLSVPFSVTFSVSELAVLIYRPLWCQNGLTPPPTPAGKRIHPLEFWMNSSVCHYFPARSMSANSDALAMSKQNKMSVLCLLLQPISLYVLQYPCIPTCICNVLRVIANVLSLAHQAAKYGWQYYINSDCIHTDYSCVKSEIKNYGSFETEN